jgi:hypothetical protein
MADSSTNATLDGLVYANISGNFKTCSGEIPVERDRISGF